MKIRLPLRKVGPPLKGPPKLKLKASVARSRRAPIVEEEDFLEEPEPNMKLSHAFVVVLVLHVIAVAGVFAFNSIKAQRADILSAFKEEPAKTAATASESVAATAGSSTGTAAASMPPTAASEIKPEPVKPMAPAPASTAAAKTHELKSGETLTKVASTYGVSVAELQSANAITDPTQIPAGTMLVIPGAPATDAPIAKSEPQTYKPMTVAAEAPVQPAPVALTKVVEPTQPAATGGITDSGKVYVVVKGDNPWKIAKHLKVSYADLLALNHVTKPNALQIGQKLKVPAAK